ncbi:hypothetical protein M495_14635 [Serratia liquefaciens ATCC 27592]|uniref:hypothetical protein n=1 Tax=Serratia liquefaciens TaxID=614 RepID=UPI0003585775|nr:hypothetical protein [Serratia liquefaciens]AGQ31642.1 hypothetical protein M495_14635 [Serratia liquefaciens ATCC 27592]
MDNKLSELKAAAAKYSLTLKAHRENPRDIDSIKAWDEADAELSRLTSHDETNIIIALLADNEAKDKRIAELEQDELATRASSRAVHEAQENHINQQQDIIESLEKKNVDLGRALGAAEKRIAVLERERDNWQAETLAMRDSWREERAELEAKLATPVSSGYKLPADWRLDESTGAKILMYKDCSVIEDQQAEYVLSLIQAAAPEGGN